MKWLAGATITFLCLFAGLPASAVTAHTHKAAHHKTVVSHKAGVTRVHTTRRKSNPHRAKTVTRPAEKSHADLRTASFRPAAEPQSSASSSSSPAAHASSKKKASAKKRRATRREPTQTAPTPDRISEIQSALARGGFYKADPSGKWDGETVGALQKFQSANGLDATGKLDALTLQKLGLGSDVAGYSAPKGIVEHSCCSMTPSPSQASPASPPVSAPASASASSASSGNAAAPVYRDPAATAGQAPASAPSPQQNASH